MHLITRKFTFSAAHYYRVDEWDDRMNLETFGRCSNPHGHGHDYELYVTVQGEMDRWSEIVVNTTDIKSRVAHFLNEELDGKFLNHELAYFKRHNPTTEHLVKYIWNAVDPLFDDCKLHRIELHENHYLSSEKEEGDIMRLSRKYHFCSAHRLHSVHLTEEENLQIFGKCNNPYGHGHNYYLLVTVEGEPDPLTGMIVNLTEMDRIIEEEIMSRFDHKHLNLDTEEFKQLNPTSEVLASVIYDLLSSRLPNLFKIGLWETEKNYFEYMGR